MIEVEPWLRGPLDRVDPFVAPLLMSFQMAREDLARFAGALTLRQIWDEPFGLPAVGFQIRHIAGSVDRLCTYLEGATLTERQLAQLRGETEPGAGFPQLMAGMEEAFARCEAVARSFTRDQFTEPRYVGRKRLPTTAIGLIIHMAEHTQRHVGQAVTTAKLVQALAGETGAPPAG